MDLVLLFIINSHHVPDIVLPRVLDFSHLRTEFTYSLCGFPGCDLWNRFEYQEATNESWVIDEDACRGSCSNGLQNQPAQWCYSYHVICAAPNNTCEWVSFTRPYLQQCIVTERIQIRSLFTGPYIVIEMILNYTIMCYRIPNDKSLILSMMGVWLVWFAQTRTWTTWRQHGRLSNWNWSLRQSFHMLGGVICE